MDMLLSIIGFGLVAFFALKWANERVRTSLVSASSSTLNIVAQTALLGEEAVIQARSQLELAGYLSEQEVIAEFGNDEEKYVASMDAYRSRMASRYSIK